MTAWDTLYAGAVSIHGAKEDCKSNVRVVGQGPRGRGVRADEKGVGYEEQ